MPEQPPFTHEEWLRMPSETRHWFVATEQRCKDYSVPDSMKELRSLGGLNDNDMTAHLFVMSCLKAAGIKCGLIGSHGILFYEVPASQHAAALNVLRVEARLAGRFVPDNGGGTMLHPKNGVC